VDAEHAGEDGCGQFRGEGEQGGRPVLLGAQADVLQAGAEAVVADVLARATAWEQPRGGAGAPDGSVAAVRRGQFADQAVEGLGQGDRGGSEGDGDRGAVVADVVGRQLGDRGDVLGVEQEQEAGDPVLDRERVVVEEPACVVPAFFARRAGLAGRSSGRRRRSGRGHAGARPPTG
jgi:hypothetical protein